MFKNGKNLGELLLESGNIDSGQLEEALSIQKKTGEYLGKILVRQGILSEKIILKLLETKMGIPRVNLTELSANKEAAASIPAALAERYLVVPIKLKGNRLTLAMVDPTNFFAMDDVRLASGYEVEPVIASEVEILRAIRQSYGVNYLAEKAASQLKPEESAAIAAMETADDAPIISIVNSIINQAITDRASDIHIEPQDKSLRVRFRIDGSLRETAIFPIHTSAALISRIKIMSDMNIAEKRLPQVGRIEANNLEREIDLRVSTIPTILGEKVVMRILDQKTALFDIENLGFSEENLKRYKDFYATPYGMVLITGPTGSGKTTTLYSTLAKINSIDKNIITIEDPVEYRIDGSSQIQVNKKAGLTFANGLRSILRQDPDVIMVGEIRDVETADIAIGAALTGHLVFSTLHTNDAPGAITRLLEMGIEPFLVSSAVLGVVAQRLVRRICDNCKETYLPDVLSPEYRFLSKMSSVNCDCAPGSFVLFRGVGCSHCQYTGYYGRMAIHEVMPLSASVCEAVNSRASSDVIAGIALREGMKTILQDGIAKALKGTTTVEEVVKAAYIGEK